MKNKKKCFLKFLVIITILLSNVLASVIPTYATDFKSSSNYNKPSVSSSYNSNSSQNTKSNSRFNTSNKYNNNNSSSSSGNINSKFNTSDKYNNSYSKEKNTNSNNDNSNKQNTNQTPNMNTGDYNSRRRSISFFPSFSSFRPSYRHHSSFTFKTVIILFVIAIIIFIAYHMFFN